jgi:low temperature requirement protein LtrA
VIIALGESIVITGATASSRGLTASNVVALAVAFFISGALFWLYFGEVAEHSMSDIAAAEDPGGLARDAYTYLHLPIIAGIIWSPSPTTCSSPTRVTTSPPRGS